MRTIEVNESTLQTGVSDMDRYLLNEFAVEGFIRYLNRISTGSIKIYAVGVGLTPYELKSDQVDNIMDFLETDSPAGKMFDDCVSPYEYEIAKKLAVIRNPETYGLTGFSLHQFRSWIVLGKQYRMILSENGAKRSGHNRMLIVGAHFDA